MIELPLSVELEVESDAEYEMETDSSFVVQGASNYITGSFTPTETGVLDVAIPYEGNGYPICAVIFPKGGYTTASSTIKTNAMVQWMMSKFSTNVAPLYSGSNSANNALATGTIKQIYPDPFASNVNIATVFTSNDPSKSATDCVHFKSKNLMRCYCSDSTYSFTLGVEYEYHIVYSE